LHSVVTHTLPILVHHISENFVSLHINADQEQIRTLSTDFIVNVGENLLKIINNNTLIVKKPMYEIGITTILAVRPVTLMKIAKTTLMINKRTAKVVNKWLTLISYQSCSFRGVAKAPLKR
jgi:hypothetical protein